MQNEILILWFALAASIGGFIAWAEHAKRRTDRALRSLSRQTIELRTALAETRIQLDLHRRNTQETLEGMSLHARGVGPAVVYQAAEIPKINCPRCTGKAPPSQAGTVDGKVCGLCGGSSKVTQKRAEQYVGSLRQLGEVAK